MLSRTSRRRVAAVVALLAASLVTATASDASASGVQMATAPVVTKVVGTGTPASCTATALYNAVLTGGRISFNCGPDPVTITLTKTLRTCNTHNCKPAWQGGQTVTEMTLDGGGLVTLSGDTKVGIYYSNACEEDLGWITSRCDIQDYLRVTFKNITLIRGNATKTPPGLDSVGGGGGGGAIAMRGSRLTVLNSTFKGNRCVSAHSDAGGGAIRAVGMRAVSISGSTFSGNTCANGGAVSSLGSPVVIRTSTITSNTASGTGASSGKGGNGGGFYFDGGSQNVSIIDTTITGNKIGAGGSGVFYVSNNRGGTLTITGSTITGNTGEKFWTGSRHDLFFLGKKLVVTGSTIN